MEELARYITFQVGHAAEIIAAIVIALSMIVAIVDYFKSLYTFQPTETIRVRFGSSVAVALELLLAADVLATAVAPTWNEIGQLAAIATIRTILNFFLEKELSHTKSMGKVNQQTRNAA